MMTELEKNLNAAKDRVNACRCASGREKATSPSRSCDTPSLPRHPTSIHMTGGTRRRPRPQGRSSRCSVRATAAASAAVMLCKFFGGNLRVGAVSCAFIAGATGSQGARAVAAPSATTCGCAPESFANHDRFIPTTSSRSGSVASYSAGSSAARAGSARRSYQQRLHRCCKRSPSMGLLPLLDDNISARQEEPSPPVLSRRAAALGSTTGRAASRLDFVRQTSVAAALVGAATSGLFLPTRPVTASSTDSPTPKAKVARSAAAAERMVWLDEDSGTVSSRLSEADDTYGPGFVAYLARFLLNYDEGSKEYFKGKLDCTLAKRDGSHVWEEFRGFVASVGLGLHKFQGSDGARELCESLSRKYGSGERNGAAQQLAMLFSLLPPEVQPVAVVKSLLYFPTGGASGFREVKSFARNKKLDFESIFGASPSALLPEELRPVYDEGVKAFYVPGVPRQASKSEVIAFGTRGPFPISKERRLTGVDFELFAACGAFGCTLTHLTVIPLDVVKTRLQTDPGRYSGLAEGVTTIAKEEGWMMLMQGLGPTLTGYLWYGVTVYPGYELFKRLFIEVVGPLNAALFRVPLVLAAGATATCFACLGVCPAEAVRIRQVSDPAVGSMPSAIRQIVAESGWGKLYEGLPSILFRQISFGMMKFLVFDFFSEFAFNLVPYLADQTSTRLSVSLTSGLVAGVCAAIVSQPADTVLSTMNSTPERSSIPVTIKNIVNERGLSGLFLGLPSRIVWSGAIISGQFLLYDLCKTALHVSADDLRVFLDVIASAGL